MCFKIRDLLLPYSLLPPVGGLNRWFTDRVGYSDLLADAHFRFSRMHTCAKLFSFRLDKILHTHPTLNPKCHLSKYSQMSRIQVAISIRHPKP